MPVPGTFLGGRRLLQPVQGGPGFFSIGGHGQQDGVAPLLHNGAVQLGDLVGLVALQHSLLVGYPGLQPIQGGRCRVLIGEHQHCNLLRPGGQGGAPDSHFSAKVESHKEAAPVRPS